MVMDIIAARINRAPKTDKIIFLSAKTNKVCTYTYTKVLEIILTSVPGRNRMDRLGALMEGFIINH